ncbi:MAG: RibD family protein [Thermoplasmatales archaeon]
MNPYVAINFACSLDGRIAFKGGRSFKFSNPEDLVRVHKMRSESDIILVGKNTINLDDPKLVVNEKYYKSDHIPDVAILDTNLTVNFKARVFTYPRKVVIFCGKGAKTEVLPDRSRSDIIVRKSGETCPDSSFVVNELGKMGYSRIMVEGGKSVITSFISEGNWNELSIFYSPILVGEDGVSMFGIVREPVKLGKPEIARLGDGILVKIKKGL